MAPPLLCECGRSVALDGFCFAWRSARAAAANGKVASDAVKVAAKEDERKIFKALSLSFSLP